MVPKAPLAGAFLLTGGVFMLVGAISPASRLILPGVVLGVIGLGLLLLERRRLLDATPPGPARTFGVYGEPWSKPLIEDSSAPLVKPGPQVAPIPSPRRPVNPQDYLPGAGGPADDSGPILDGGTP